MSVSMDDGESGLVVSFQGAELPYEWIILELLQNCTLLPMSDFFIKLLIMLHVAPELTTILIFVHGICTVTVSILSGMPNM